MATEGLYFNASHLPAEKEEYVAWVDVMGIQSVMGRSLKVTANFVFKLHVAALEAPRDGVILYPVMDGLYASTPSKDAMESFLCALLEGTAKLFIDESRPLFRFIVKGAIAYGPVVHGRDLPSEAAYTLSNNANYRNQVLLGLPMVQAHMAERLAPAFGIYIHESARTFAPEGTAPFHNTWWDWLRQERAGLREPLAQTLMGHYDWCDAHSSQLLYERDRISVHKAMAHEFLVESKLAG